MLENLQHGERSMLREHPDADVAVRRALHERRQAAIVVREANGRLEAAECALIGLAMRLGVR